MSTPSSTQVIITTFEQYNDIINDAAALAILQDVFIGRIDQVSDVSMFGHVNTLQLYHLPNVSLAGLGNVNNLTLSGLDGVTQLGPVKTVEYLYCYYMKNVCDIGDLQGNSFQRVSLQDLNGITDVSSLINVPTVHLINLYNVSDVSALRNSCSVELQSLPLVADVGVLSDVKYLNLLAMDGVTDVSKLCNVPYLNIQKCNSIIMGIDDLTNNTKLYIHNYKPTETVVGELFNYPIWVSSCDAVATA